MTSNDVLAQLGVFLQPEFLTAAECDELISVAESTDSRPAAVYGYQAGESVDRKQRRASEVSGCEDEIGWLQQRLEGIRPVLSDHFGEVLTQSDTPTLLIYGPGDFFLPHRDNSSRRESTKMDETAESRKVTAVVYLNSEGDRSGRGDYEGGELTLYGLMQFPGAEGHGFPVQGTPGLLVAFRAGERHGVSELTRGRRYCALTWYH